MRAYLLLPVLSFVLGCEVDPSKVKLICDGDHPCPTGQFCGADGICQEPADLGMISEDMGDMTQPGDLRGPDGCAGTGGKQVGQAVACPGAFAEGQAASLCDATKGYHICKAAELSKINLADCDQLSGFFIVEVPGYFLAPPSRDSPTCGTSVSGSPVWFGCGGLSSALVHKHPATKCSGLDKSVDCSQTGAAWVCKAIGDLSKVENKTATDGTVCCK